MHVSGHKFPRKFFKKKYINYIKIQSWSEVLRRVTFEEEPIFYKIIEQNICIKDFEVREGDCIEDKLDEVLKV